MNTEFNYLLGKTLEEAKSFVLALNDLYIYPTKIDEKNICITCNLDFNRLKVEVKDNIITKIVGLG